MVPRTCQKKTYKPWWAVMMAGNTRLSGVCVGGVINGEKQGGVAACGLSPTGVLQPQYLLLAGRLPQNYWHLVFLICSDL